MKVLTELKSFLNVIRVAMAGLCCVACGGCRDENAENVTSDTNVSPAEKIQKIVYVETGPFGPTERYTIDFEGESITGEFSYDPFDIGKSGYRKEEMKQEKARKIIKKLSGFTGKQWSDRYENPHICDGTFWRLYLTFADGSARQITGANKWPGDFSKALCLREIKEVFLP